MARSFHNKVEHKQGNRRRVGRILGLSPAVLLVTSCGLFSSLAQPAPTATVTPAPSPTPTQTVEPTMTPLPPTVEPSAPPPTPTPGAPFAPINVEVLIVTCYRDKSVHPSRFFSQFHLYWQDLSNNEDGFHVYRDGNLVAEVPADKTEVVDSFDTKNSIPHTYYVVAYNALGETKSERVSITCQGGGGGGGGYP
jgi:hypothetical protein